MLTNGDPSQSNPDRFSNSSASLATVMPNKVSVASWPTRGSTTQNPNPTDAMTNANRALNTTRRSGCVTGSHPVHKATATKTLMMTADNPTEARTPSPNLAK